MGSVFSDKFIVQRLTDMRWMALSSMEEDSRVYHNARILVALRKCLKLLQKYYQDVDSTSPPFVPNQPHPRYFPYPTSFTTGDGTPTYFRYLKSLEDHPASVTYLAEITDQSGATGTRVKVVVKFVASYGEEVHKFLAQKGWAPTLLHYGPLRENTPPDGFLGPTGSAPPGLHLHSNLMSMVVMDYIDAQPKRPPNAHLQIKDVLTQLHINGYVFGDLRPPNVLFDADGKVKFIDFNWCGRYDRKICDEDLADGRQNQIEKMDCVQVGDGPYAYYPLAMSTIEDMWVPGMEPLAQIRPVHDIKMLHKFLW
jgi:hypothetical protein